MMQLFLSSVERDIHQTLYNNIHFTPKMGITIRTYSFVLLVVFIVHINQGDSIGCEDTSIGIENVNIFPDSRFTATSSYDASYAASKGRIVTTSGWGPGSNTNPSDNLKIDLGFLYVICAVATQGRSNINEWTTKYLITTSVNGNQYSTYRENGADKLFTGNTNKDSIVKNTIKKVKARYIRFYPKTFSGHKVLRVGIFGYREECETLTTGVENKYIIPDSSLTASSVYSSKFSQHNGRLNKAIGWAAKTNNDPNDYLQIDLGLPYVICAVATQGRSDGDERVTAYKIILSLDNSIWTTYTENGVEKVFYGNVERNIIFQNQINNKTARYVRFLPTAYVGHKTMRAGLFGYIKACHKRPIGMESGVIQDGSITASSAQHPAKNARLHYTSGSSWCASTSDSSPYLQIDLGVSHLICAVATQGNSLIDQWVKTYQIETSTDGTTWTIYQENNIDRTFYGNYDRSTVVRQVLYYGIVTRYLRIVPKTYQTSTPCLRTEIYGYPFQSSCSSHSSGIPSSSFVPDHRFTATSVYDNTYLPYKGRLGLASAWAPKTNAAGEYLQIDLGDMFYICAVATQGSGYSANEYVTRYKLQFTISGSSWTTYSENNAEKEFTGNTDRTTVVTNPITNPFKAKFLRVLPTAFTSHKSMRIEFKGLVAGCASSLGIENSQIPDSKITSSSLSDNSHSASRGRLYGGSSWCSTTTSNTEYIQVDLGQVKTVTGIATQGDRTVNKWTITYKVSFSFGKGVWFEYKEGASTKIFNGNTNKNDVKVNWLTRPLAARYIRILPQVSNAGHCLRFDLYGCEYSYSPKALLNTASLVLPSQKYSSKNVTCKVLGEPTPDFQWLNNGIKINGATQPTLQVQFISAEDIMSKFSCTIQDPNTRSLVCNKLYTCRTKYIYIVPGGTIDEATAKVTVHLSVPKAPVFTAIPSQRSVRLHWTLLNLTDEVGMITGFKIDFNNQSSSKTISLGQHASNYTLSYLQPYTNYTVRMNAISTVGQGLSSNLVYVTTDIAVPDGIPSITSLTAMTSRSIRINWQFTQTDKVNGPMAGYRIMYSREGGPIKMADVGNFLNYILTSLEKNTIYNITVSVRNPLYIGQPSVEMKTRTLEDAPECAPVLKSVQSLSANSVLLIWSSLQNLMCTNGLLRGYKAVYKESQNESAPFKVYTVNSSTAITTVLWDLIPSVEYTFQVLAFTVKDGPLSNLLSGSAQPVGSLSIVSEKMTPLVRAALDEKVIISCHATGARPIKYSWLKGDAPINSSSVKVLHNFLVVETKTTLDYGRYICNVSNNRGESVSYEVKIEQLAICDQSASNVFPGNLTILRDKMTPSVKASIGDKVVIGCFATGGQPITYTWTLNGAPINNLAIKVIHNVLVVQPKSAMDYGTYLCNVTNNNGTDSYPVKLLQLETCKELNSSQRNLTILSEKMAHSVKTALNERVVLSCFAVGAPPIRYTWIKDNATINSTSIKVIDNVLVIEPKSEEDYGTFLCTASNGNETASYAINLTPLEMCPKTNHSSQKGNLTILAGKMTPLVKAAIGQNVSIGCYATGTSPIRYKWTKNNAPISNSAVKVIDNVMFIQPRTTMDYGMYQCRASNNANETASYHIELAPWKMCNNKESNSSETKGKLTILRSIMMPSVAVAIGDNASIGCYANGAQPIMYTWIKDGAQVNAPSIEVKQNILVVQPNTLFDYGTYLCNVSNGNETDSYSVQLKPIKKCESCSLINKSQTNQGKLEMVREKMTSLVKASFGDKVSLGCYAIGAQPIKYSWTKDNQPIKNSATIKVIDDVVVVHPKTSAEYGTYVCGASNGRETTTFVIKLQLITAEGGGESKSSQSKQDLKTIYLPVIIVLVILLILLILITVYFGRYRRRQGSMASKPGDTYMTMDNIIQTRNESTRQMPSLPSIPTGTAASRDSQTESHYDSIDPDGGYVNAAALSKEEDIFNISDEDVYALKNSRA